MTSVVILADTHLPKRAKDLPSELWAAIETADVAIHAGDWVSVALLDDLRSRVGLARGGGQVVGVWGNNDGDDLRAQLPEIAHGEIAGVRFAVTHETGRTAGRERRMDAEFPNVDVLVFGHSHIPFDAVTPNGMRLLNPGSPTDRRRQPVATFMTVVIEDEKLGDVQLVPIDPQWRTRP